MTLPDDVLRALAAEVRIDKAELTGSRASGRAMALSDWDFKITTAVFPEVREALPGLVRPWPSTGRCARPGSGSSSCGWTRR
jgi:hypothetical protein